MKSASLLLLLACFAGCASPVSTRPATGRIATTRADEQWAGHEAYIDGITPRIQKQWERLLLRSRDYPAAGTRVVVTVRIEANRGAVEAIVSVDSTGPHRAAASCVSAITDSAPFGAWTPEMKKALGQATDVTFTFLYQ